MTLDLIKMPWLPRAPADFRARLKDLALESAGIGTEICELAAHALENAQSIQLAKAIGVALNKRSPLAPLSTFRLGLLASSTFDLIVDELIVAAARHGVVLSVVTTPYDQVAQQAMDPGSTINSAELDAVLLAVDYRWLQLAEPDFDPTGAQARIDEAAGRLTGVAEALRMNSGAPVILQTVATPPGAILGNYDCRILGSTRRMIAAVNDSLVELASKLDGYVLDTASLAAEVGTARWFDPVQWNLYKIPFAAECSALYSDHVGRLVGSIRGKAKKCLVLDLDNTTWGGVIGDDGIEGIKIGQGSPEGEAHLAIQKLALTLRDRGVILAISSKNDEENARRPFREHPDMLLKESDIAVFQANWIDKPSNLVAIAKALNIGVDALVLLDDNAAERAQVRAALPTVGVPEIGSDPSQYPLLLASAGYFEAVSLSEEDRIRARAYSEETQRAQVLKQSHSLGDYLSSLDMTITHAPFNSVGRARITQLINKSNQFNLTTRRYTEAEVADAEADPSVFTLQVRLRDRFGDAGMIGVLIARPAATFPKAWRIDIWLMSCRVLGRKVEEAMLAELVRNAHNSGMEQIFGDYIPTAKNAMVNNHYKHLGFLPYDYPAHGVERFSLDVKSFVEPTLPMRVDRLAAS
jgi:FkbH-like protein